MTGKLNSLQGPALSFGPFRLIPQQRLLFRDDTTVQLGSRAREILLTLVERAGEVVTKSEILERVWPNNIVEEGTLRVHIAWLRKALGDGRNGERYVENVTGQGYRFVAPVTRRDSPLEAEPLKRLSLPEKLRSAAGGVHYVELASGKNPLPDLLELARDGRQVFIVVC